jgi:hypothetical protein
MLTTEQRLAKLEHDMRRALATTMALQGQPSDATLSLPHNDSLWYADNIDGTHAANLYYIIPSNVGRIVSAKLSLKMLPYRTYNTLSVSATGGESVGHSHGISATHSHGDAHTHNISILGGGPAATLSTNGSGGSSISDSGAGANFVTGNIVGGGPTSTGTTAPGSTDAPSADHTHNVSATGVLGVTEGATATGVTIAFDGVDQTAALGGPFNADVVELDVRRFFAVSVGAWHLIAMQPTAAGRINAHLRLGYYASAGSVF